MAFEFKRLADVEAVEAVAAEANIIIEEDGQIKKVAKDQIGTKDAVKSVNGVLPDEAGNVVVEMPEIPEVEVTELKWENIEDKPFGQEPNVALSWEGSNGVDEPLGKGDGGIIYDPDIFGARYDPQGKALLFTFSDGTTKLIEGIWETAGYPSTYTLEDFEFIINPNDIATVVNIKDGLTLVKLEEPGAVIPLPEEFLPEHSHEVSWDEVKDKPFGKETKEVVVLELNVNGNWWDNQGNSDCASLFTANMGVFVEIDGKQFETNVGEYNAPDSFSYGYHFNVVDGENTVRFSMCVGGATSSISGLGEGDHHVRIFTIEETITTLPAEFLPEDIGGGSGSKPAVFKVFSMAEANMIFKETATSANDTEQIVSYEEFKAVLDSYTPMVFLDMDSAGDIWYPRWIKAPEGIEHYYAVYFGSETAWSTGVSM